MLLPDKNLVIFDLETTDGNMALVRKAVPEIVEVGAVRVNKEFDIEDELSFLVQPEHLNEFSTFCRQLTGISSESLREAPPWSKTWERFAEFTHFRSTKICSFGTEFDVSVLQAAYREDHMGYPHSWQAIDAKSLVYSKLWIEGYKLRNWKLSTVCERFGVERPKIHRALPDAKAICKVLKILYSAEEGEEEIRCYAV